MTGERRLWLLRHGETEGQSSVRFYGATDVPLSDAGRAQVRALAPLLRGVECTALVHSTLSRAAESARIVSGELGLPAARLEPDHALRELDFGRCEGLTVAEIERTEPDWFVEWRAGRASRYPGGEEFAVFDARVGAALDAALARHRGDVLVVAHRGTVKAALRHLLGFERERVRPWPLDLASATVFVERPGSGWLLERYNLRAGELGGRAS